MIEPFIGPPEDPDDDEGYRKFFRRLRRRPVQVGPATGHSERMDDDFLHSLEDAGDMEGYDRLMKIILENPATEP